MIHLPRATVWASRRFCSRADHLGRITGGGGGGRDTQWGVGVEGVKETRRRKIIEMSQSLAFSVFRNVSLFFLFLFFSFFVSVAFSFFLPSFTPHPLICHPLSFCLTFFLSLPDPPSPFPLRRKNFLGRIRSERPACTKEVKDALFYIFLI